MQRDQLQPFPSAIIIALVGHLISYNCTSEALEFMRCTLSKLLLDMHVVHVAGGLPTRRHSQTPFTMKWRILAQSCYNPGGGGGGGGVPSVFPSVSQTCGVSVVESDNPH